MEIYGTIRTPGIKTKENEDGITAFTHFSFVTTEGDLPKLLTELMALSGRRVRVWIETISSTIGQPALPFEAKAPEGKYHCRHCLHYNGDPDTETEAVCEATGETVRADKTLCADGVLLAHIDRYCSQCAHWCGDIFNPAPDLCTEHHGDDEQKFDPGNAACVMFTLRTGFGHTCQECTLFQIEQGNMCEAEIDDPERKAKEPDRMACTRFVIRPEIGHTCKECTRCPAGDGDEFRCADCNPEQEEGTMRKRDEAACPAFVLLVHTCAECKHLEAKRRAKSGLCLLDAGTEAEGTKHKKADTACEKWEDRPPIGSEEEKPEGEETDGSHEEK